MHGNLTCSRDNGEHAQASQVDPAYKERVRKAESFSVTTAVLSGLKLESETFLQLPSRVHEVLAISAQSVLQALISPDHEVKIVNPLACCITTREARSAAPYRGARDGHGATPGATATSCLHQSPVPHNSTSPHNSC